SGVHSLLVRNSTTETSLKKTSDSESRTQTTATVIKRVTAADNQSRPSIIFSENLTVAGYYFSYRLVACRARNTFYGNLPSVSGLLSGRLFKYFFSVGSFLLPEMYF